MFAYHAASGLFTPVGFDSIGGGVQSAASGAGAHNWTWSHTISAQAKGIIVGVSNARSWSIEPSSWSLTASCGSTAMTQMPATGVYYNPSGSWYSIELFYLVNPPTGTQTMTVTVTEGAGGFSVTDYVTANSASFFNVHTITPATAVDTATTTSIATVFTGLRTNIPSNSLGVVVMASSATSGSISAYSGGTQLYNKGLTGGAGYCLLIGDMPPGATGATATNPTSSPCSTAVVMLTPAGNTMT